MHICSSYRPKSCLQQSLSAVWLTELNKNMLNVLSNSICILLLMFRDLSGDLSHLQNQVPKPTWSWIRTMNVLLQFPNFYLRKQTTATTITAEASRAPSRAPSTMSTGFTFCPEVQEHIKPHEICHSCLPFTAWSSICISLKLQQQKITDIRGGVLFCPHDQKSVWIKSISDDRYRVKKKIFFFHCSFSLRK